MTTPKLLLLLPLLILGACSSPDDSSTASPAAGDSMAEQAEAVTEQVSETVGEAMDEGGAALDEAADKVEQAVDATRETVADKAAQVADKVAAATGGIDSEAIYNGKCAACHKAGVAGAPKLDDSANWAPRIAQGEDVLVKHAIEGFKGDAGYMPPKGGFMDLSDEQIRATVSWMTSQAQ